MCVCAPAAMLRGMTSIAVSRLARSRLAVLATFAAVVPALTAFTPSAAASSFPTCTQLTKAQLQPLLAHRITKITVTSVNGAQYLAGNRTIGQTCVVADTETSNALGITVIGSGEAAKIFAGGKVSSSPVVAVPGVGDRAVRQKADAKGAASPDVFSIKGSTYCTVDDSAEEIGGEGALDIAAGDTSDIGDKAYADIAAAEGTLCNRIYNSGSKSPAAALAALKKIKVHKPS
jgi:hypothetical protein